jgi:hypothetical protein
MEEDCEWGVWENVEDNIHKILNDLASDFATWN